MKRIYTIILAVIVSSMSMAQSKPFTITAHSGAYDTEENSMEFIMTALVNDDDIIEFDVRQRPDGTLVMSHDPVNSNNEGTEIEKALKAIKGKRAKINLDIKEIRTLPTLYNMVRDLRMTEQIFMTGIEINDAAPAKLHCPGIPYYLNCKPEKRQIRKKSGRQQLLKTLKESNAIGVNCNYKFCTRRLLTLLHANGYKLSIWTIDKIKDMRKYSKIGPDNITTRHPDTLKATLNKK